MSFSVSGSNASNPFASLQSLWQQQLSASGTQTPSDPLSALLSALNQQGGGGGVSSASGSNGLGTTAAQSTSPQFGPQTLQALLALQSNGTNAQTLAAQFDGAANGDPLSALGSQSSQGSQGHDHHHRHGADGSNGSAGSGSGTATSNSGGANAGGNDLAQLLQMQAQLVAPAGTQSAVTA
jgi:hypothetical protein